MTSPQTPDAPMVHADGTSVDEANSAAGVGADLVLDPAKTAVVSVDVQRLFTDLLGVPVSPPLVDVLPNITRVLDDARRAGAIVVLVRTIMTPEDHSPNTLRWPAFMQENLAPGSPGTEWDPCVVPHPGDVEIIKLRYSAFFGTELDARLRERGIETVVILGLTTNVCVQSTVRDAWQHGYDTITLSDCCSEMGDGAHESSLFYNARNFGRVYASTEIMSAWKTKVG
jgi:nicotinamidase-related amidase